jgi:hypothetical protein
LTVGIVAVAARRRSNANAVRVAGDELPNRRVYQRVSGASVIAISGTYTGAVSSVEARVIDSATSSEVVTWTTVSALASGPSEFSTEFSTEFGASGGPQNGVWNGSLSVPQGGWYKLQYRLSASPAAVFTSTNILGVGDIWMLAGYGQQARMSTLANAAPTPDAKTVYLNADASWTLPGVVAGTGGNGGIRFLNLMRAATNVPQACLQVSVEGVSILDWEATDAAYTTAESRLTAVGTIAGLLWQQGGSDIGVVTRADYKGRLGTLFSGLGSAATIQRFAIFPLMQRLNAADTDANTQEARLADYEYLSANTATINLGWVPDISLSDDVNQTAVGSEQIAYSYAHALLYALDAEPVANIGPAITAASRSGTAVTLTVQHRAGTAVKINTGTQATGFQVFPRGAAQNDANALAIASIALNPATIVITLSADPGSAVDVYYQWGRFDAASPVFDNTTALGRTIGNALQPLMTPAQTAVETGQFANPALKFDAATGLVRYSDTPAWDLPDADWTLGMFLRVDTNVGTSDQYFFSTGSYGAVNSYNFLLNEASSGAPNRFEFNVRGAGATSFTAQGPTNAALTDNQWRLWIVERVKSTDTLNIYYCNINGTRTLYHTISVAGVGGILPTVGAALATRAPQATGSGLWLDGAISYFFSMAGLLTQDEVRRLAGGNDLMTVLGRSPSVYTKLNTLTTPIANSGTGGTANATLVGPAGITLTEGPKFTVDTTAVQFNETNTIYTMPDSASFNMPDGDWTLGFMFALDDNVGNSSQHIYSTGGPLAAHCINLMFYEASSTFHPNQFSIQMEGSSAVEYEIFGPDASALFDGQWRLWTIERNKTGNLITIYYTPVNGTRATYTPYNITGLIGSFSPPTAVMTIGGRNALAVPAGRYFGGKMYMAFQMDGMLSALQTQDIARGQDPVTGLGLSLKWYHKFTDTAATRTDLSGNNNTATLGGTATQVTGPTFTPNA